MSEDSNPHEKFNRLRRTPGDFLSNQPDPTAELPETVQPNIPDGGGYDLVDELADGRFPDSWSDDDVAFLASFVREYFGAHLVVAIDDGEADYRLFTEAGR